MNDNEHKGLLPAGLGDMLPPEAALEASVIEQLMARLAANGYDRVKPPLVEFEQSLLAGAGQQMASQTFRLMDPISQRMLGVRADMTLQIARIAASRLRDVGRPLRLSYAGQVLRVKGSQLRPERQFAQIGAELIGTDSAEADAEAVLLSALALRSLGIETLSVDLNLPTLLAAVGSGAGVADDKFPRLHDALERKDEAGVRALLGESDPRAMALFVALLRMTGPADAVVAKIAALELPEAARIEAQRLGAAAPGRPEPEADGRSGRVSRLRVPYRRVVHLVRAGRAWRAGARRALPDARRRGGDRLHPLHGYDPAGGEAAGDEAARAAVG